MRNSDVLVPTTISKRPRLPRSCWMNCVGSTWMPRISSNYFIIDSLVYSPHPKCLRDSFPKKKSCKNKNNSGESCRYRSRVLETVRPCRKGVSGVTHSSTHTMTQSSLITSHCSKVYSPLQSGLLRLNRNESPYQKIVKKRRFESWAVTSKRSLWKHIDVLSLGR